jgi:2-polyprenyl-3-methyl-5-hydroxy-6-metoxy-1,4-benzoquinol methylase
VIGITANTAGSTKNTDLRKSLHDPAELAVYSASTTLLLWVMILHKLLARFFRHKDDEVFYWLQAVAAIDWIAAQGVRIGQGVTVLDLGCGHGIFGRELLKRGCSVVFSDEENFLATDVVGQEFIRFNIDRDDMKIPGKYDLVVCSNVYEHLSQPERFLLTAHELLKPDGVLYLSWTNWLSPWGGHEFSPLHYLGSRRGHLLYDKLTGRQRKHTPYVNLFPTYIGSTLRKVSENRALQIKRTAPRYYTELGFIMHIPLLREFLAWNCAMLIARKPGGKTVH